MADSRLVSKWLAKAGEDLGFASSVIEESQYFAPICFHYQQSAEKYLKAFIVAYDLEFRKIHDLLDLLKLCVAVEPSLGSIENYCAYLSRFYLDTRYPVHWPSSYSLKEAQQAREAANAIANAVTTSLKASGHAP
jgi:HEPN domain-containing protein